MVDMSATGGALDLVQYPEGLESGSGRLFDYGGCSHRQGRGSSEAGELADSVGEAFFLTRMLLLVFAIIVPVLFWRLGNGFPFEIEAGLASWLAVTYGVRYIMQKTGDIAHIRQICFRFCLAEVVFLTWLVHRLGVLESAGVLLYAMPVLLAGFYLSTQKGATIALTGAVAYAMSMSLESLGIVNAYRAQVASTGFPGSGDAVWFSSFLLCLAGLLAISLMAREFANLLRHRNERFDNLSTRLHRAMNDERTQRLRAETDPITGLLTQARVSERLEEEIGRARRSGRDFAVIMLDVDNFRMFNDVYGPLQGDELLRSVGSTLQASCRSTDTVGRHGSDEFILILPETKKQQAQWVAEKMRTKISSLGNITSSGSPVKTTVSVGVATYPYDSSLPQELIALAGAAMRMSKDAGGDTVTVWDPTEIEGLGSQNSSFGVLEGLMSAIDSRDGYAKAHAESVAQYSLMLAERLRLPEEIRRSLRMAALLHDVGKIGIPQRILLKNGVLDSDELEAVRQHPLLGENIISQVPHLLGSSEAVRHHHERWDGTGYPRGLTGTSIPILSRIISIADAYSAMLVARPYRPAKTEEEALEELRSCAGGQFDPELAKAFIECLIERKNNDAGSLLLLPGPRRIRQAGRASGDYPRPAGMH